MRPVAIHIPRTEFVLIPAPDIHWPAGEKDLLREWVDAIRSKPNAYTILMGDTMDFARTKFRNAVRSYREDENSQEAIDDGVRAEARHLAKVLQPIRDRIWGVLRGNHYWEFLDGINSEQYLCQLLKIRYLGALDVLRVKMKSTSGVGGHRVIKIYCHHTAGTTSARTTGGDIAGMLRAEQGWDADIYLAAHTHRRLAWKEPVLTITSKGEPKVVERSRVFARCGALLKSFKEDNPSPTRPHHPSYPEHKSLRATDLGWVEITVRWRRRGEGGRDGEYPEYQVRY